jgi:hypothetical protein
MSSMTVVLIGYLDAKAVPLTPFIVPKGKAGSYSGVCTCAMVSILVTRIGTVIVYLFAIAPCTGRQVITAEQFLTP